MPYIPEADRRRATTEPATPGELNYAITTLLVQYMQHRAVTYTNVAEALAACTEAAAEFRRRVLGPLENRKMSENGDVFPRWLLCEAGTNNPQDGGAL